MSDDSRREESNNEQSVAKQSKEEADVPFASRRLQSFPVPSLEVIVGPEEKLYRYHGLVLALQSSYVDILLSSPAATALQETQKITFPDIPVDTWDKMMTLLAPGGSSSVTTGGRRGLVFNGPTILEVLPFYDKYQFMDGIRLCDDVLQTYFEAGLYNDNYFFADIRLVSEIETSMMVMSVELNLPLSKESALKLAQKRVRNMMYPLEEDLQRLLPLVENDAGTLRSLAYTLYGRKAKTMSVDEMRMQAKEEGFAAQIIQQRKALQTLDQKVLRPLMSTHSSDTDLYLTPPSEITTPGHDVIPNSYQRVHNTRVLDEEVAGVMKYVYIPKTNTYGDERVSFAIEAKDVFGNEWELVKYTKDEENEERTVLYVWDGGYSSYVAPEHGWVPASSP